MSFLPFSPPIASTTVLGVIKAGSTGSLAIGSDGSADVVTVPVTAGTPPSALSGLTMLMASGQSITGTALQSLLSGTAPAVATAYTTALSAASGVVGTPVTVTVTPTTNAWPSGVTITPSSTGAGTFSPTSSSPSGTTAATFSFTPSAAATGTINTASATPAMTNTTGGLTFTATAATVTATAYTTALSATTGATGATVTVTFTPTSGTWPASEVITPSSTTAGTFNPATVSVSGSTVGTATFTPSAAGTASITSTVSVSMANSTGALTYTVTAAASGSFPMTFTGAAGAPTGVKALTPALDYAQDGAGNLNLPSTSYGYGRFLAAGKTTADGTVTASIKAGTGGTSLVLVWRDDGAGNFYSCFVTGNVPPAIFRTVNNGSGINLTTVQVNPNVAPASTFAVKMVGSTITVYIDGQVRITATDTNITAGGYVGIGSGDTSYGRGAITQFNFA